MPVDAAQRLLRRRAVAVLVAAAALPFFAAAQPAASGTNICVWDFLRPTLAEGSGQGGRLTVVETERTLIENLELVCTSLVVEDLPTALADDCVLTAAAGALVCGAGGGGGSSNSFETITPTSGTAPVADSATDTLTVTGTAPITVTGNATADSLTLALTQHAGTNVTVDLEEETHAAEHHQGGGDDVSVEALASACGAGAPIEGDGAGGAQCGTDDTGTDDQTAAEVPIADAGALYTATDVEDALQETPPGARTPTAHAASHAKDGADELLVEGQGTACTDGQILVANTTGGLACGAPGSASFTTWDLDYGDEVYTSVLDAGGAIVELPNSTAPTAADCDAAAEAGRVHVDTDAPSGEQLYVCEGLAGWVLQGGGAGGGVAYYRDEKASGTVAGDTAPGAWNTRTLNTESADTIGATLSANAVTLPAGTYRIRAQAPAIQVGFHRLRLFDVTNTATLAVGPAAFSPGVTNAGDQTSASLWARVTLGASTALRLDHWTQSDTRTDDDLGSPISTGDVEVYAELWIEAE